MKLNKEDLPPTDGKWKYNRYVSSWHSELDVQLHNSLGPAVIYDDGTKEWWVNGKLHRLDGPATVDADGTEHWYINGRGISKRDFHSTVISFLLGVDKETARIIECELKND